MRVEAENESRTRQLIDEFRLSFSERLFVGGLGLLLLGLLATAWFLKPSPLGFGTHRQLGLPPCTVQVLFGIHCPMCGMTTSWVYLTHGDFLQSLRSNCGGTFLGLLAIAFGPICCWSAYSGRSSQGGWIRYTAVILLIAAMLTTMTDWMIRVWF